MNTLARLIDRRTPLAPETPCAAVARRFHTEKDAQSLAVVEGERPLGLVNRDIFLSRMDAARGADDFRPVSEVMDPAPLIAQCDQNAASFRDQALSERPDSLSRGFIVVDNGRYMGVGTALALLAVKRSRARAAQEGGAIATQMLASEVTRQMDAAAGFINRLSRTPLPVEAQAWTRALEDICGDVRRLMERGMQLHGAELGLTRLDPRPHLLRDLMDDLDGRWKVRSKAMGVTLLVSYDGDPDYAAMIDAVRLTEVFDAIVERAIAETRGPVEVSLRARPALEGLMLEGRVRDSGPELEGQKLARIFDPAFDGGVGGGALSTRFGMALAARVIVDMAGVIRAEPNPGAGSSVVFEVIVPEARVEARHDQALVAGAAAHILIVDDNATNRMVAEALCEMFDCTSEQATDGVEAVEAMGRGRFDLILMDIKMPRMDGVQATRAIRALVGPAADTPIVALTANADPDDVRGYMEAGMNAVVEKPIKADQLLSVLQQILPDEDAVAAA